MRPFRRFRARVASLVAYLLAGALALGQEEKTKPPANPGDDGREAMRKRFLDNELWYGRMVVVIHGSGERSSAHDRRSYSVSHEAEVNFRIPVFQAEARQLDGMERAMRQSPAAAAALAKEYERLRDERHWVSETTNRKPEDDDDIRLAAHDRWQSSGDDPCDVEERYSDSWTVDAPVPEAGAASPVDERRKGQGIHRLTIDLKKGTYDLTLDPKTDLLKVVTIVCHSGQPAKANIALESAAGIPMQVKNRKLPETGNILFGSIPIPRRNLHLLQSWDFGRISASIAWTLSPVPLDDLLAVPTVEAAERGTPSRLDGSASRGKITKYIWTLNPAPAPAKDEACCPEAYPVPERTFETSESVVEVMLLCSMQATLKVSDGERSSKPAEAPAPITPRDWKTDVQHFPEKGGRLTVSFTPGWWQFGVNICAIDHGADEDPGGVFHHDLKHNVLTWEHDAYELAPPIADPRSPFDGWVWVKENKSRIHRRPLLNRDLFDDSEMAKRNAKDPARKADFRRLVASVRQHEMLHTQLYKEKCRDRSFDPARGIERAIGPDDATARREADLAMSAAENWFGDHYDDLEQKVRARVASGKATVLMPPDYEAHEFPNVADIAVEAKKK